MPPPSQVGTPFSYDLPPGTRWPTAVAPASALPPTTPDANRWTVASSTLSSVSVWPSGGGLGCGLGEQMVLFSGVGPDTWVGFGVKKNC